MLIWNSEILKIITLVALMNIICSCDKAASNTASTKTTSARIVSIWVTAPGTSGTMAINGIGMAPTYNGFRLLMSNVLHQGKNVLDLHVTNKPIESENKVVVEIYEWMAASQQEGKLICRTVFENIQNSSDYSKSFEIANPVDERDSRFDKLDVNAIETGAIYSVIQRISEDIVANDVRHLQSIFSPVLKNESAVSGKPFEDIVDEYEQNLEKRGKVIGSTVAEKMDISFDVFSKSVIVYPRQNNPDAFIMQMTYDGGIASNVNCLVLAKSKGKWVVVSQQ